MVTGYLKPMEGGPNESWHAAGETINLELTGC